MAECGSETKHTRMWPFVQMKRDQWAAARASRSNVTWPETWQQRSWRAENLKHVHSTSFYSAYNKTQLHMQPELHSAEWRSTYRLSLRPCGCYGASAELGLNRWTHCTGVHFKQVEALAHSCPVLQHDIQRALGVRWWETKVNTRPQNIRTGERPTAMQREGYKPYL